MAAKEGAVSDKILAELVRPQEKEIERLRGALEHIRESVWDLRLLKYIDEVLGENPYKDEV